MGSLKKKKKKSHFEGISIGWMGDNVSKSKKKKKVINSDSLSKREIYYVI